MTNEKLYEKAICIVNDIVMMDEEIDLEYIENIRNIVNERRAYSPKLICNQDIYLDRITEFSRYLQKYIRNEFLDMLRDAEESDYIKIVDYAQCLKHKRLTRGDGKKKKE